MTRLCPNPGGRVSLTMGITHRNTCRSTTSGWTCIRLLHHLPHRKHSMTWTGPSFLPVSSGHPTGICGRRRRHHLHDVADDVDDACVSLISSYVCDRHISAYVCERHILPMYARDIFLFIRFVNRVTFPERLLQIIKIQVHLN